MKFFENINLVDTSKANDSLKQKCKLDMGMGHAGGYADYDRQVKPESSSKKLGFTIGSSFSHT